MNLVNIEDSTAKYAILVVDDDNRIRKLLAKFLREHNFLVFVAKDTREAKDLILEIKFDLMILDVMMPDETGVEFSSSLRQSSRLPILMLSAMGEVDHRISGLESGADDYMVKPFEPRELLLRIKNILERSLSLNSQKQLINIGEMSFDLATNRLTHHDQLINLTLSEANLLSILAKNIGIIMSREGLSDLSGGVNERSIDVQIIRLRNKIEKHPREPRYLHTIRGKGYVLYDN
jgi:two-component system phosphate regulon response regulator OmpR